MNAISTRPPTTLRFTIVDSPIDPLLLTGDGEHLTGLYMSPHTGRHAVQPHWERDDAAFSPVADQLTDYFAGQRTTFDVPLAPSGTDFQRSVWSGLCDIPYGETISYGELARRVGVPNGSRAVGLANGRNPISVIVPCHRVIGADGSLTGYGGGLPRKKFLLGLESRADRLW
ncbi:MAG TPA: methylated-DNA--[protein]-cysteine S-methyltransferase [Acidimicrobiales bacterium]